MKCLFYLYEFGFLLFNIDASGLQVLMPSPALGSLGTHLLGNEGRDCMS